MFLRVHRWWPFRQKPGSKTPVVPEQKKSLSEGGTDDRPHSGPERARETFPRGGREGAGHNHYSFFKVNFTTRFKKKFFSFLHNINLTILK